MSDIESQLEDAFNRIAALESLVSSLTAFEKNAVGLIDGDGDMWVAAYPGFDRFTPVHDLTASPYSFEEIKREYGFKRWLT